MTPPASLGAVAPDFRLPGSTGTLSLAQARQRGKVVIFFMREFSCMICQQHVRQLSRLYPQLQANGTEVLVIGGGTVEQANTLARRYTLPFPVLADPDHHVYDQFGLTKVMGMLQRSAIVVVDQQGRISYLQRATLPTGVFDKQAVLAAVKGAVTAQA